MQQCHQLHAGSGIQHPLPADEHIAANSTTTKCMLHEVVEPRVTCFASRTPCMWHTTNVAARRPYYLPLRPRPSQDFTGFRVLVLYPRERMQWPAPGQFDKEGPKSSAPLGAPKPPLPRLTIKAKALSAATIRAGPDYLEVPFVATHETKRGRGSGRCVLEAMEDVARALGMQRILLCSTNVGENGREEAAKTCHAAVTSA